MNKLIRLLAASAALACAVLTPAAHASTVIDFEGDAIAGLYFPGDTFSSHGFTLTVGGDFGAVGIASDLGPAAPSGNATQFFFNSNDGFLTLTRDDALPFSLDGFSVAFVPLIPAPSPSPTIVIVAYGVRADGTQDGVYWRMLGSTTTSFPFSVYNNPADFNGFKNLVELQFFACVLDSSICATPTRNNAQFAVDNILVTAAIPEPASVVLMSVGLLGLALRSRRNAV